jgi:hypothetical protein
MRESDDGSGIYALPADGLLGIVAARRVRPNRSRARTTRDRRQAVDFNLAEYSHKGRGLIELSAEMQGKRNPMIDRPEWASAIDFTAEWASATLQD